MMVHVHCCSVEGLTWLIPACYLGVVRRAQHVELRSATAASQLQHMALPCMQDCCTPGANLQCWLRAVGRATSTAPIAILPAAFVHSRWPVVPSKACRPLWDGLELVAADAMNLSSCCMAISPVPVPVASSQKLLMVAGASSAGDAG
jgi:hypothetical protein